MVSIQSASPWFPVPIFSALDPHDTRRLLVAVGGAETAAAAGITRLISGLCPSARTSLRRSCRFAHQAVLLFPSALDLVIGEFENLGLDVDAPIPSVLVRRRLCGRYGLTHEACDVSVTRVRTGSTGVEVELFLFPKSAPELEQGIIDAERAFGFEDHLAMEVDTPDERTLDHLMAILQHDAGLVFEGGGHNPHAGATGGTMLYFVGQTSERSTGLRFERFELYCRGDFSTVVERHPVDDKEVGRVYSDWAGADPRHLASAVQAPTRPPS